MRNRKLRNRPNTPKGAPGWMVTYSDLVTLVLVFFILLFSMSQVDVKKFKAITESFRAREILEYSSSVIPSDSQPDGGEQNSSELLLQSLLSEVQDYLEQTGLKDTVVANRTERGVVLVLQEQVLFETGDAAILNRSHGLLNKVGSLLKMMPNMVKVEGHTDNRPITTEKYPSNWELSAARSSSVIRYFIENYHIDSRRFIAVGFGETRPIVSNNSQKNWKKNRRVEIVILDPMYEKDEEVLN